MTTPDGFGRKLDELLNADPPVPVREIARQLNIPESTVRGYKKRREHVKTNGEVIGTCVSLGFKATIEDIDPSYIEVDDEFQSLLPPLTEDEHARLESQLLSEGCRDAIVVWLPPEPDGFKCYATEVGSKPDEHCDIDADCSEEVWHCRHCDYNVRELGYLILDGHNRYGICQKHDIPFFTVLIDLPSREAALAWIVQNQLARRNLPDFVRVELALRLKPMLKAEAEQRKREHAGTAPGRPKTLGLNLDQVSKEPKGRVAEKIGEIAGVGKDTVRKVEEIIEKAPEETKRKLRSGDKSIESAYREVHTPKQVKPHAPSPTLSSHNGTPDSSASAVATEESSDPVSDPADDDQETTEEVSEAASQPESAPDPVTPVATKPCPCCHGTGRVPIDFEESVYS